MTFLKMTDSQVSAHLEILLLTMYKLFVRLFYKNQSDDRRHAVVCEHQDFQQSFDHVKNRSLCYFHTKYDNVFIGLNI